MRGTRIIWGALILTACGDATPGVSYEGTVWSTAIYDNQLVGLQLHSSTTQRIDVGAAPIGLVHDSATQRLFSSMHNSAEVWVANAVTGTVDAVLDVGGLPYWMLQSARGEIFVANSGDASLCVIDPAEPAVIRTLHVGGSPIAFELNDALDGLYVADLLGGRVAFVDMQDGATRWETVDLDRPIWVASDIATDRLFVAESRANNVAVLNRTDGTLLKRFQVGSTPTGLFVLANVGLLAVIDHTDDVVEFYDLDTLQRRTGITVGDNPVGAVVSPDGTTLLLSLSGANALGFLNVRELQLTQTLPVGNGPRGLVWLP